MGHFRLLPTREKNVFFAHSTSSLPRVPASQETGRHHTKVGLCLDVLRGTWEPDPFLDHFFLIGSDPFCIAKRWYRTGSSPYVHSETSRHRLPTALKLDSKDSQLSGAYALPSLVVTRVL